MKDYILSDAWRGTLAEVNDHIFWLQRHIGKEERYHCLMKQYRLPRYLNAVRRLTEYEMEMTERGMEFKR